MPAADNSFPTLPVYLAVTSDESQLLLHVSAEALELLA